VLKERPVQWRAHGAAGAGLELQGLEDGGLFGHVA